MKNMHKYTQTSNMERLQLPANAVETTMRKRVTAGRILSPRSAENQLYINQICIRTVLLRMPLYWQSAGWFYNQVLQTPPPQNPGEEIR